MRKLAGLALSVLEWFGRQQTGLLASTLVALLFAGATVGSMQARAVFTAVATNSALISAGTVAISTSVSHAFLTATGMLPGEAIAAPLTLANTGTLDFRYRIASTASDPDGKQLASQLRLTIHEHADVCSVAGPSRSGDALYHGSLAAVADGVTENPLVGVTDRLIGVGADDRLLQVGANETLCFRVELPEDTARPFSAASTTVAFVFRADQAANRP